MRASEYVDPNEAVAATAEKLIAIAREAQQGRWPATEIVAAIGPLIEAVQTNAYGYSKLRMPLPEPKPKRTQIPFMLKSLDADEVAELLGVTKRYFQEQIACHPQFPRQANPKEQRPRWIAGEVVDWRIHARPALRRKSSRVKREPPA